MALTDLTRISTSGIATGSTIDSPILRKDVDFRGNQVGVTSVLFDSSERELNFKDNVKLTFGDKTNGDLQVYHNGSDNYIDATTGSLYFRNTLPTNTVFQTGNFLIKNQSNNQNVANFAPGANGGGKLYHENVLRFNTTSSGAVVTGVLTATSFSGPIIGSPISNPSGISTFYDVRVINNLTVEGTTTTLDTNLIGVDRVEVGANSNSIVGVAITQSGTADLVNLFDGATKVVTVDDVGNVGLGTDTPSAPLNVHKVNGTIAVFGDDRSGDNSTFECIKIKNNVTAYPAITNDSSNDTLDLRSMGSVQVTLDSNNNSVGKYFRVTTNGEGSAGTELFRIEDDGKIGIGTVTPESGQLQVIGNGYHQINISGNKTANANKTGGISFLNYEGSRTSVFQTFASNSANTIYYGSADSSARGVQNHIFYVNSSRTATSGHAEALRITSDGRVSIGNNPSVHTDTIFHVQKSSGETNVKFEGNDTMGARLSLHNNKTTGTGIKNQIDFCDAGGQSTSSIQGFNTDQTNNLGELVFATRSAQGSPPQERLRIKSDGTVYTDTQNKRFGIGQDPDATTMGSTSGTWQVPEVDGQTIGSELRLGDINTNSTAVIRLASYGSGDNGTGGGAIMFTNTRNGSNSHHSDIAAIKGARETLGKGYLRFFTANSGANTEKLRITSAGDVGISSTAPRAKLDVKDQGTSQDVILRVSADDNNPYALVVGNDTFNTTSNRGLAMWVGGSKIHHITARTSTTQSENTLEIEAYKTTIQTGTSLNQNFVFDSDGNFGLGVAAPTFAAINSISANAARGIEIFKDGTDTGSAIKLAGDNGSGNKAYCQLGYSGANASVHLANYNTSGTKVGEININTSGNVGINESTATAKLHVTAAYNETALIAGGGAINYNSCFIFKFANGDTVLEGDNGRHVVPGADAVQDLGISTKRWRNVYTTDLQLSNVGGGGNEVDGTEGSWTLQEGESDIYMINRKTGKKYKMMLQEVS